MSVQTVDLLFLYAFPLSKLIAFRIIERLLPYLRQPRGKESTILLCERISQNLINVINGIFQMLKITRRDQNIRPQREGIFERCREIRRFCPDIKRPAPGFWIYGAVLFLVAPGAVNHGFDAQQSQPPLFPEPLFYRLDTPCHGMASGNLPSASGHLHNRELHQNN